MKIERNCSQGGELKKGNILERLARRPIQLSVSQKIRLSQTSTYVKNVISEPVHFPLEHCRNFPIAFYLLVLFDSPSISCLHVEFPRTSVNNDSRILVTELEWFCHASGLIGWYELRIPLNEQNIPEINFNNRTQVQKSKLSFSWGAFDSAKNHKRQRRKRQSVTAKREKSQTPKFV